MQPSLEKFPQEELHQTTMEESMGTTLVSSDCVDIRGRIADKRTTGGWKAAPFIIVNEVAERLAFYRQLTSTTMQGKAMSTSNRWPDMVLVWCTGPYSPWYRRYQAMRLNS
ncbi:hypothetical protein NC651_014378 [Populus alba x Populus x berolinensis]|nr:hypothetical protein NC651_014378 [Populus alba x Populus x berolinensis]